MQKSAKAFLKIILLVAGTSGLRSIGIDRALGRHQALPRMSQAPTLAVDMVHRYVKRDKYKYQRKTNKVQRRPGEVPAPIEPQMALL